AAAYAARRAAVDVAPVDVAFEAKHELVELPVVADGAADQAAVDVTAGRPERVAEARAAEAVAAVDADVEAGPIVDRRDIGRRRSRRRHAPRDICRRSLSETEREHAHACEQKLFHDATLTE